VRIETDGGIAGWGEACPWGATYLPAHGKGARAGIAEIAPRLIGLDPRGLDRINRAMDLALPGHDYAKAALDIACWDILGKATGLPAADLLGGRYDDPVSIASSIGTGTPEEMLAEIERYRARGYHLHSAKVGADVARDIERIRFLQEQAVAGETIIYDANRAWTPAEAATVMNAVRDLPVAFEQPCETYEQNLQLRRLTSQVISLDEGIKTLGDLLRARADGACELINIKLNRVGGLTKARRMRDFCAAMGIRMNIEETGGSVIADTAAVHLAEATPGTHRRATWLCHEMLTIDTAVGGARNEGGMAKAPEVPGLGVEPIAEILGEPVAVYE